MISAHGEKYIDSLYSQHHLQAGTEELLLPLNVNTTAYPTQIYQNHQITGGMVSHLNHQQQQNEKEHQNMNFNHLPKLDQNQQQTPNYGKSRGFDPNNYMTGFVNKNYAQQQQQHQQSEHKPRPRSNNPSTPKVLSTLSPNGHDIYEATYSGSDVYELLVEHNSIMRRRADSWVNATHILKV